MSLSDSDFLWQGTGFVASGTSVVVTHPDAGGTTAGTTILVCVYHSGTGLTLPSGFTRITSSVSPIALSFKENVSAGETSWTFTIVGSSAASAWCVLEIDRLNLVDPMDVMVSDFAGSTANGGTRSTTTTGNNTSSSAVGLAFFGAVKAAGGDVQSWSGYTNSYIEVFDGEPAGVAGKQLAMARRYIDNIWTTHETTATFATSAASASTAAGLVLLRSVDAAINAPLTSFTGFEFGTHAGMGNTLTQLTPLAFRGSPTGGSPAVGTWGTEYAVAGGSARFGSYGLKITASASAPNVATGQATTNRLTLGFDIKVESVTGEAVVAYVLCSGTDLEVLYDGATTKFGIRWTGGTAVWQTSTTALNTWKWIDIRLTTATSTHHADWTIEGDGSQTSPADLTGQAVGSTMEFYLGCLTAETFVAHYDNVVLSVQYAAYPVGPHEVQLLVPETTGATVSGTSTNFSRFTANGTLAAVSGTEGALLDEIPPTISASSDGVVQTAVAASDYLNLPMTTFTLASDEIIAGVRLVASMWGGTGTGTGTLGWRGYDGTTETTFENASSSYDADSLTAASSTYPIWRTSPWPGGVNGSWTQTRLNAAAVRMGFSTDATPDMGASAVYLEVATRPAPTVRTLTIEDPISATVDLIVNPYNSATVSYVITNNDPALTAQFDYSISGTPQTPVTVGPSSSSTLQLNADAFGDIDSITLTPA